MQQQINQAADASRMPTEQSKGLACFFGLNPKYIRRRVAEFTPLSFMASGLRE